ncbi:MAG: NAD-dependent epimerase/dehydratase family protein [Verrucomicrobiota bacterium]
MKQKSLITGGAGFMGSHLALCCLKKGHDVVVLDDLSGGFSENLPEGVTFVAGSITDHALIDKLFEEHGFDYVYHLAAYAAEGLSHFIRRYNYENNLIGSMNLINASLNSETVKRFVFTSSIAVYGAGQTPMSEKTTPQPEDPYGVAKYAVEMDLQAAHEMFGLDYTVFRPHNVYGEGQNIGDRYRNVVGIFMNQVMQDLPMSVFGDGLQTRAFTHVDDVAPLIADCVDIEASKNQVFNVGSEDPRTVLDVAQAVAKAFGKEPDIRHLEARNEVVHAFSSNHHCNSVFGEKNTISLEEGITRMAEWAKQHGPRETPNFTGIEVERNLPPSWRS